MFTSHRTVQEWNYKYLQILLTDMKNITVFDAMHNEFYSIVIFQGIKLNKIVQK